MDEKDEIVVEELEEQTEPKQDEKAELSVQSFKPSDIGGVFFTETGLTVFPKGFMEQFAVDDPNGGLIGKQSTYDYSKLAGAFERVVTLEKENHDLKEKVAKLEAKMAEPDEDKEKEKPVEEKPEDEKDKEKDKVKAEEKEEKEDKEEKEEEKKSAVAKSVEAEKKSTKEEAEHSGVDDDIKRVMGSMKKAREEGAL